MLKNWFLRNKDIFLVFFIFLLLLVPLQFSIKNIIDYDGYLHIKMAQIIKENGFIKEFPWITESILSDNYADTNLLFRILLIPFTFGNLELGAKIAALIFSALCFAIFYWFLRTYEIKYPFLWTVLFFVASAELMYRFLFPRPMALSVIFLLLTLHFLFKKRYFLLAIISFLYVWLYAAFVFQLVVIFAYFLIEALFSKKNDWKLIGFPILGALLGIVINPYFYSNITMLYLQLFKVNLGGNLFNEEWRAWDFKDFILNNGIFLALFISATFISVKKINKKNLLFFLITLLFLIFAIKHRRMQEYFAPFAILFFVFSLKNVNVNQKVIRNIVSIVVIFLLIFNFIILFKLIPERNFLYRFDGCSDWLKNNAPKNSLVFIDGYAFNYLFFKNSNLRYTHGIDGMYSYLYDTEKFKDYTDMLQGKDFSRDIIKEDYNPDYVFVGKIKVDAKLYSYLLKHSDNYLLEYENQDCAVLKVK